MWLSIKMFERILIFAVNLLDNFSYTHIVLFSFYSKRTCGVNIGPHQLT